jgi:8-oxo-dGTP pyrophosphatase MutT (NUDIX family)
MSTLNDSTNNDTPIDAATVILLRESAQTPIEVLLLCRGNSKTVMNNAWVFPGGKMDRADAEQSTDIIDRLQRAPEHLLNEPGLQSHEAASLFAAACRETHEETGVRLEPAALVPWSRWITPNEPSMMKKRFDARFFIAAMPSSQTATHDGVEATDSMWLTPRSALRDYVDEKITLAPPQIMSLAALARFNSIDECMQHGRNATPPCIQPGVVKKEDGSRILTYPGDDEHPDDEQRLSGPTRLIWRGGHFEPENGFDSFFVD